ncbi:hypothetical protein SO802_005100 [Lithocarpus litseifolius]|uniref:RNase H type-1 domain-containing protein n=1 Tax=Lithocarpus litseifolius TaxID=425828 RepID=A0AAW2DJN2_9ROSI
MSLLFWNVRGLGNRRTVRELEGFIRAQDPTALFLAETWVGEDRLIGLCLELGFDQFWVTPQANRLGCLALFWKNSLKISVSSASPNHIDAVVGDSSENKWRLTCMYGFADPAKKWDFNEILWSHEKCGLGPRKEPPMKAFREVLDELGLKDLGFVGKKFTWKGRRHDGFVLERLDRAVANNQWLSLNSGTKVQHLHSNSSDHQAIVVKPEGISPNPKRPFKFEQMWLRDSGGSDTVINAWGPPSVGATMPELAGKVRVCGVKLTEWSKNSFGSVRKMIEEKKNLLTKAEMAAALGGDIMRVKSLQKEINEILEKENQMWQQRSRALFLKCGDRNTAYSHSKASQRHRRNRILALRNSQNVWCEDVAQIKTIAVDYYQTLFTTSSPSGFSDILDKIQPSVTDTVNEMLLRDYNREEVVSILIDKDRNCWIDEAIDNNFLAHEAKIIKAIPLSLNETEDKLCWCSSVDGQYSVKAGYNLLVCEELNSNAGIANRSLPKSSWKGLWKLKTPSRIKTLLWRANADALPTRANLVKRKVLSDPTCQACGAAQESTLHALWSCPKLSEVWSVHFSKLRSEARNCSSFLEVFQMCLEKSHPSDLFAMIVYLIWFRRNKLRVGETVADLKLINSMAKDALLEFQQAFPAPPNPPPARSITKWLPPPKDWVKANFDGAIFQGRDEAGIGIIIRNDHGLVMTTLTQVIPLPTSVEIVEVLAARRALIFASELGFDQVILEGDSEIAIRAMNSEDYSAASFGHIISDIKSFSSHFRALVFQHTRRLGNKVAHRLARAACTFSSSLCTWMEEVPVCTYADYSAETINTT